MYFLQLTRKLKLEASGGADTATVTFEASSPYRHYVAWVKVASTIIDVDVQPKLGGINDGGLVNISTAGPIKVIQAPADEIRPATVRISAHPDDDGPPLPIKSELEITNGAAAPAEVSVFILAGGT